MYLVKTIGVKRIKWCRENVVKVVEEDIYGEGRKELICDRLAEYGFEREIISEFEIRYDGFVDIVKAEFN